MTATKPAARVRLAAAGISPRGLDLAAAAAYVGLSPTTFMGEVAAGTFPGPFGLGACRRRIWDRAALDRALDRASGLADGHADDDRVMAAIRAGG